MKQRNILPYRVEPQEQSAWCWAAVAASTVRYYDPTDKALATQCNVATKCLGTKALPPHVDTCCGAPWDSNLPFPLANAMDQVGTKDRVVPGQMPFDEVAAAIDRGQPVAVQVTWSRSLATHFVVIRGYCRCGDRSFFNIADPWNFGSVNYHDADEFLSRYLGHPSTWDESVLTKAPRKSVTMAPATNASGETGKNAPVEPVTIAPTATRGLQRTPIPQDVFDELVGALKAIARVEQAEAQPAGNSLGMTLDDLDKLTLDVMEASRIYMIDPNKVEAGQSCCQAEPSGWECLIPSGGGLTAKVLYKDGKPRLTALHEGPFVNRARTLIGHYAQDNRILNGSYECRVMSAPWAYVYGLWFKDLNSTNDANDFVIPLEPTHHLFNFEREYDLSSFDGALKDAMVMSREKPFDVPTEVGV